MWMSPTLTPPALHDRLQREGFAFVTGDLMRGLLPSLDDWAAFAASWNDLGPDTYLAARGRQRRRRHAAFVADEQGIRRQPHQPHYQRLEYNALQGDIERWFEPVLPAIAEGASLRGILGFCHALFGSLSHSPSSNDHEPSRAWHVEVHQFRIEARADQAGEPTPEGVHRDGVDYVLVLMIDRENIESGTTTIHAPDHRSLGSFTLAAPLDAALLDDHRVFHGVTAVTPKDPARPAHRDVLVVTFRAIAD